MKHAVLFFLFFSLPAVFAQQPGLKKSNPVRSQPKASAAKKAAKPKPVPTPLSEKEQFEKASAFELAADRVPALEKFLADFPQSENRPAALELLLSSRLLIAEEKLLSGDGTGAVALFKTVVEQMPQPVPADFFSESIARIPTTLFFRGMRPEALEIAAAIETKVETDAAQLLEIANFHLATENGGEAMRVAAKAAARDPKSAAVQRTIALAHRINFDLDLSADAYAKSLELDPESVASKRGLAEMKRALGKPDEAVTLYRELLTRNEKDLQSRTGLVLALFDAGKRAEAESELAKSLEQTPGNVILLAGAAYWYASKGLGDKAVEYAEKAITREPRYVWSHIALARGQMAQNKPVDAEQTLIKARTYGNFPTLEYELASARMAAGFYREAAEDLQKQFTVTANGNIRTNLGGRVPREEKSLTDLAAFERRASIFTPVAADSADNAEAVRTLLILEQKLQAQPPNESEIAAAADAFVAGSDKMKIHRQLHAASLLLQKRVALGKVIELTRAATGNTDAGLEAPNARAAVLASELYEARATAFRRKEFLVVPDVPQQTLSGILRGRIEETAGWALYQQNNFPDAIVRLRRAITVMPDKSAWWRSSMWRLGAALAAEGKDGEALNAYIESYKTDKPDFAKYAVVEAMYRKVHGNTDGLEAQIGSDRVAVTPAIQEIRPTATPSTATVSVPAAIPDATPAMTATPAPTQAEPVVDQPEVSPVEPVEMPTTESPVTEKQDPPKTEAPVKTEPAAIETPAPKRTVVDSPPVITQEETKPVPEAKPSETESTPAITVPEETKPATEPEPPPVESPPSDKPAEVIQEKKEPVAKDPVKPATKIASGPKPLFEPIIITVGRSRTAKTPTAAKPSDSPAKTDETGTTVPAPPVTDQDSNIAETISCVVGVSQENVSLINGGGSVGILVNVEPPGDVKDLRAVTNSPKDIELTLEPEIGGVNDRRFYVIKSVSSALGVYQVTFSTPCGKKNLIVTVR